MVYKTTVTITKNSTGNTDTNVDYFLSKAKAVEDLVGCEERYGMSNNNVHLLDGSIIINMQCQLVTMVGMSVPLKDKLYSMEQLQVGDCWRGINEPEGTLRVVQQVGKTEVYSPLWMGTGGHNEVYLRSSNIIILYTEKI